MSTNSDFIDSVLRNVVYWQQYVKAAGNQLTELDPERENLHKAVLWGLKYEESWHPAAELALALFKFVESRSYGREWQPLLRQAVAWCEAADEELRGRLLNRLGQLAYLDQKYEQARQLLQEGLITATSLNNKSLQADIQRNLALTLRDQQNYTQAKVYGWQAYRLFEQLNDPKRGQMLNMLGSVLQAQGQYEQAIVCFQQALEILEGEEDWLNADRTAVNLAVAYQAQKQYDQALETYQHTISLCHKVNDHKGLLIAAINMGSLYASRHEYESAAQTFSQIDTIYLQQIGDLFHLATVYNNLGFVRCELGQFEAAEELLKNSLELRQKLRNEIYEASTQGGLADLYSKTKRVNEARQLYTQAISLLEKYPQNARAKQLKEKYKESLARLNEAYGRE